MTSAFSHDLTRLASASDDLALLTEKHVMARSLRTSTSEIDPRLSDRPAVCHAALYALRSSIYGPDLMQIRV